MITTYDCTNSLLVSRRVEEGCALCTIIYIKPQLLVSSCLMILNSSIPLDFLLFAPFDWPTKTRFFSSPSSVWVIYAI